VWKPGQHTGTFRGNNLAFVSARVALETYWADAAFAEAVVAKGDLLRAELDRIAAEHPAQGFVVRGRGLMMGIACDSDRTLAGRVSKAAFERGLVIETSGAHDEVLKFLPALTITDEELRRGLAIVRESLAAVVAA
jgi:diaminobutyrate-2-oxoglutarate transaminase